ncbi:endonuclease/exonuclease/phosphatase family protein [Paludibacterium paludis]|uniref:Endonuclease/exonuclease/phosphatase domain-containing protein n=1 Tax=Paludibacterium paludis TaxID=1225769 RepID=A0A918P704_9NEIS|nr:endonuclease/exonuclease/phosphatase family protein [Paludibacterium paludis]GGY28494.1 hypothetical protein GCM10011289_34700 [Paludibacterium paludis]
MKPLRVVSYNIHKGMSPLNRHVRVDDIARALGSLAPDLVFLQEVQGRNALRALRHPAWPAVPQHHFLARHLNCKATYGLNAAYDHGHHGNALLSRHAVETWCNRDISVNAFERRGLLHCRVTPRDWRRSVAALCVHLNLLGHDRRKQCRELGSYIRGEIPEDMPLILAGDFNDWSGAASADLLRDSGLEEVFQTLHGRHAASFPARLPLLALDRIYARGLVATEAKVLRGAPWSHLSDHLPIEATLVLKE